MEPAKWLLVAGAALLVILLVVTKLVVVGALAAASIGVSAAIHFMRIRSIGIELVTFTTVIAALAYGGVAGAIIGFILISIHIFAGQFLGEYVLWVIPGYVLAGFLATWLTGGAAQVGLLVALALNGINMLCTLLVSRQNIGKYLPYAVTNVLFNWVLFAAAGQPVAGLLQP